MMADIFSFAMLSQGVRIAVPYALAALGAAVSETGGVVNIAVEGIMLSGAFCAVLGAYYSGNAWVGLLSAVAGGVLMSLLHAVVTIKYRADQIISGFAINMLAVGVTKFFLKMIFHSSVNSARIEGLPRLELAGAEIDPFFVLSIALVFAVWYLVKKTVFGLRLRAAGENPECAETLGIDVRRVRCYGVLICGALAALAGAWLAFDQKCFSDGMSGGRGYIALAAMILGRWNPVGAVLAALLFGLAESFQIQLQTLGVHMPTQFTQMIPYVVTLAVLSGFAGKSRPPAADGRPYPEEE